MNGQVKKVNIKHIPKIPDHKAVKITLAMKYDRETGYWKLNVNYLEDINYKNYIIKIINDIDKEHTNSLNPVC